MDAKWLLFSWWPFLLPEVLAQPQSLPLVVRLHVEAVQALGLDGETFVGEASDNLPVFDHERHFVRAHLEHSLRAAGDVAESRIEEAGVVDSELANERVVRNHFGRKPRRHFH